MMLRDVFPKFRYAPPAEEAVIVQAEAKLGVRLPEQLRYLYLECDGCTEDRGGASYLLPLDSLVDVTETMWTEFKVPDLKPFVFFGSSSADIAWGISLREPSDIIAYHHHMEDRYDVVGTDIVSVWQADYSQYEEVCIPASPLENRWRQCSACSDAWEAEPNDLVSRCPGCGRLTRL